MNVSLWFFKVRDFALKHIVECKFYELYGGMVYDENGNEFWSNEDYDDDDYESEDENEAVILIWWILKAHIR